ncbi:lipoprotein-releasing ABC transporter permease subunit [Motiliproteus sp. MSK22-1]|uniref:lipoprotein-releasing ABC transporter permease subunit n=1 Tax=Motiliproteus sp. MSK22-1 TaxID=1897630 RepID=UPI0009778DAA|nr:lipoprotein-releasing ABC transporter permease subunit [Motiliproteus sp. MSK22-1]OMH25312.1 cell division protein FtsX [Motiliproteus sp. MSK22-1]
MFRPLSLFVGLRYTGAKRSNHFISFISLVSMIGLTLGVAVLILVLSVMNGFDRELRQRILGMVPHATISQYRGEIDDWSGLIQQINSYPAIEGSAPYIDAQGMLTSRGVVRGVLVNGIEPEYEGAISIIKDHMTRGRLENLKSGEFGIILGDILARSLGAFEGDKVTLVLPEASISVAGVFPRLKRFTVVGTFKVGAELDANIAYIHINDAAKIKRIKDGVQGVRLKFDNLFDAPQGVRQIAGDLGENFRTSDWTRTHGNLFQAIQLEKKMIGLLLFIIVAVAAFNIVSTLVMVVTDKRSDIAILRTMGASSGTIMRTFIVQGGFIGVIGTLAGTLLGILLALTVTDLVAWVEQLFNIQFLSAEVYFISYLPSELRWPDVTTICLSSLVLSLLATIYPAYRASQTQPAEALRYE